MTRAPSAESFRTRSAMSERGQGQRPSAARLFSSMATMTMRSAVCG